LNFDSGKNWVIIETGLNHDTINYWITDSSIYNLDTLKFELKYQTLDSTNNYFWFTDTLTFRFFEKRVPKSSKRKKKEKEILEEEPKLETITNYKNNATIGLNKNITFINPYPITFVDTSKIHFFLLEDTLEFAQSFEIEKDSVFLRKYRMINDWEEGARYRLFIEPGAFTDIYNKTNDTIEMKYKTREFSYYGKIFLNITGLGSNIIVQLMNSKEKILQEKAINKNGVLIFEYLYPVEYMFKIIFDTNENGKWDTGNYLNKIQPEKVKYYEGEIKIRSNWDLDLDLDLEN